jgi:hypothetical protein
MVWAQVGDRHGDERDPAFSRPLRSAQSLDAADYRRCNPTKIPGLQISLSSAEFLAGKVLALKRQLDH